MRKYQEIQDKITVTFNQQAGGYDLRYFKEEIISSDADNIEWPKVTVTSHSVTAHSEPITVDKSGQVTVKFKGGDQCTIVYNKEARQEVE